MADIKMKVKMINVNNAISAAAKDQTLEISIFIA